MKIKQVCSFLLVSLFVCNIFICCSSGNTDNTSKTPTQIDNEKLQNDSIVRFIDEKVLLRKVLKPGVWLNNFVEINGKSYEASYVIIIPK